MRKLFIKTLLCILCVSALLFTFSACKKDSGYKLNFYVEGELYKSVSVMNDGSFEAPSVPVKDGYVFTGWFTDNGTFNNELDSSTLKNLKNDVNVFANFEALFIFSNGEITGLSPYAKQSGKNMMLNVPEYILGKRVTSISSEAFNSCFNIVSINIPKTVTSIGVGAFSGCKNLVSIEVDDGNDVYIADGNCLVELDKLTLVAGCKGSVIPAYVLTIGENAFVDSGLVSVSIPEYVVEIREGAFSNCKELTEITFNAESTLSNVDENAFENCVKLESITLPNGTLTLGRGALSGCINLKTASLPHGLLTLGDYAFSGCEKLETVTFRGASNLNYLGKDAFYNCASLKAFAVPSDVGEIQTDTFYGCVNLKTVTFASDSILTKIGDWAFGNCESLENLILPSTIRTIFNDAFNGCLSLTALKINANKTAFEQLELKDGWKNGAIFNEIVYSDGSISLE